MPRETRLKIYKLRQSQLIQKKNELLKSKKCNSPKNGKNQGRIRIKTGPNNNISKNTKSVIISPVVVVDSSDKKIYIPNSTELQKLEWSLNHRFFLEEEAKYNESESTTDTE